MYVFGGRDETGARNRLFVLKIGQRVCEWVEVRIAGPAPLARYGHTMSYCPSKAIAVVFGGRNDQQYATSGESYLNDVWILGLEKLSWTRWENGAGPVPVPRYSHCAAVMGGSVLIFGGLGEENYCRSDVHALEVESGYRYKVDLLQPSRRFSRKMISEKDPAAEQDEDAKRDTQIGGGLLPTIQGTEKSPLLNLVTMVDGSAAVMTPHVS